MTNDLSELNERLQECHAELVIIDDAIRAYINRGLETRVIEEAGRTVFEARLISGVPTAIRSKVGTFINELRSILDGLANILADRALGADDHTYFPISATEDVFNKDGLRKIKRLSDADQQTIIDLKPWASEQPLLFALHRMDIGRKHKGKLAVHASTFNGFSAAGNGGATFLRAIRPAPEFDDQWRAYCEAGPHTFEPGTLRPTISLAFVGPKELQGRPAVQTLAVIGMTVQAIVDLFKQP
jgi:hypothetical protein